MPKNPELPTLTDQPPFRDSSTAQFVYFDFAPAFGVLAGAIQIELASRVLVPREDGGVEVHVLATGHLRCSPAAAGHLREAINKSLDMIAKAQEQTQQIAANKLN
jgi:hypothetical protein